MKHDLNNIDHENFHVIVSSIVNAHKPLNHTPLEQIMLLS